MAYKLDWFEILTYHKTRYVIYGFGQEAYHLMDWRGCNFCHGRLPNSPVFNSVRDALKWLVKQVEAGKYKTGMRLPGHSIGDETYPQGCDKRIVSITIPSKRGNLITKDDIFFTDIPTIKKLLKTNWEF